MNVIRLFVLGVSVLAISFLAGCAFFETPQERSGLNPKPFNSQVEWEYNPYNLHN